MSGRDAGWEAAHAPVEVAAEFAALIKENAKELARPEVLASGKIMRAPRR